MGFLELLSLARVDRIDQRLRLSAQILQLGKIPM